MKKEELQKKHREQMKEKREQIRIRKERTRRLIIRGAIAEKIIQNAEQLTNEQFEQELQNRISQETNTKSGKNK